MKIKIAIFSLLIIPFFLMGSSIMYAQTQGGGSPPPTSQGGGSAPGTATNNSAPIQYLQNPLQATSVTSLLTSITDFAIFIGTMVAILMFIYIGFKFVMAQGNSTKLEEAKRWFFYAAIGTAILISSKIIVEVVRQTFVSAGVVNSKLYQNN